MSPDFDMHRLVHCQNAVVIVSLAKFFVQLKYYITYITYTYFIVFLYSFAHIIEMVHPLKYHNIAKGVTHLFAFNMKLKAMLLFVLKMFDGEVLGDMRFSVKCMGIGSLR